MLNRDELLALIEREGINEFFPAIDAFFVEECGLTVYELETDYYAVMMRIFPPAYCGEQTEQIISSALTSGLPANTVVQFHQISSRNMTDHINMYANTISDNIEDKNLDNPEILRDLHNANIEFLKKHTEHTVFEKSKIPFFLRDYINTATILFPMRDNNENHVTINQIVPLINKFKGAMYKLAPVNVDEHQYIRIMRELVSPYRPLYEAKRDPSIDIRDHISDADAIMADDGRGVIRLQSSKDFKFDSQIRMPENKRAGFFTRLMRRLQLANGVETFSKSTEEIAKESVYFAKVLTRKMFPEYIDLHTMSDLTMDYFNQNVAQQIPLPYVITMTVLLEEPEYAASKVKEEAQWNLWQLEQSGRLAKFFPELQMRAQEAHDVIQLIDREGEIPMKGMWSMVLYSKDKHNLEYYSAQVNASFQRKSFILQEEDLISIPVFLYSMPMNYHDIFRKMSKRFSTIFKSNVAAVIPLGTDSRGFGREPIVQLYGRNGQPQNFDLYDPSASNKNSCLIAPSGKGKSFAMSRIVWSYLKGNAKIRIIDSGHSYREICSLLGGQYITFPEGNGHIVNPFTNVLVNEHGEMLEDDLSNIVILIGVMAGIDFNKNEDNLNNEYSTVIASYVSLAVSEAYGMKGRDAGLLEVGLALRNELKRQKDSAHIEGSSRDGDVDKRLGSLIASLRDYTDVNGRYFSYVNGTSNVNLRKDLVILDLDDLSTKEKRFRDFILASITNVVQREFYTERDDRRRKLLIIDEAWQLLENGGGAGAMIAGLYRRARKLNGSITTITQSITDYMKNDHIKAIFENSYWRLFLEQDAATIKTARDNNHLVIDDYAMMLLETVQSKPGEFSEMMVLTQPGGLMIGRILATRVEYWINTQGEQELVVIDNIAKRFGVSRGIARVAIGYLEMNNSSIEEEIFKATGHSDVAMDELMADIN